MIEIDFSKVDKSILNLEEFIKTFENHGIWTVVPEISYQEAIKVVCGTLKNDEEMYRAYKDNIAMAFKDCMEQAGVHSSDPENHSILVTRYMLHEIANQAAKDFLDLLIK